MKKLYIIISVVVLSVVIALGFSFSMLTYQPQLEPQPQPESEPEPEPEPTKYVMNVTCSGVEVSRGKVLATFTGSGTEQYTTNYFNCSYDEWRIEWSYVSHSEYPELTVFNVYTYAKGEGDIFIDAILKMGGEDTSGTSYIHNQQGTFYMKINVANTESYTIIAQEGSGLSVSGDKSTTQFEYPINETLNYSVHVKYIWDGEIDGIYDNGSVYCYDEIVGYWDNELNLTITHEEDYNFTNESSLLLKDYRLVVTITLPDRIETFEARGNQIYDIKCSITIEVKTAI